MSDGLGPTVQDVMTNPVTTITAATGLKEPATLLRSGGFSALPVVDPGGRVIGVVSETDLLVKVERLLPATRGERSYRQRERRTRWMATLACHLMSRPAVTVGPDAGLGEAARLMHHHGLKRLPVVDDEGRPIGIVSRGDLLKVFLRGDDEIHRDVLNRLQSELSAAELALVTLAVGDGVVSLHGGELEERQARRMMEIAERVEGVVAVRHHLLSSASAAPNPEGRAAMNTSGTEIEQLSNEECERILRSHSFGRIALADHGQPWIFPVNYAADDRAIVFRTTPGVKLSEAPMSRVAFELDEVDPESGVAWSVMVQGVAYEISDAIDRLSESLRRLVVEPMAPGEREAWVAVIRHQISGRRFRLRVS